MLRDETRIGDLAAALRVLFHGDAVKVTDRGPSWLPGPLLVKRLTVTVVRRTGAGSVEATQHIAQDLLEGYGPDATARMLEPVLRTILEGRLEDG